MQSGSPVMFQMIFRNVAIDHTNGTMTVETIETDPHNTEAEIKALDTFVHGLATRSQRAEPTVMPTVSLREVIDAFLQEKGGTNAWTRKTRQEWESLLARYSTHCDVAGSPFRKETARSFKADVLIGELGTRTVNKHLSRLSTFFGWAKRNGYVLDNVFDGLAVTNPKARACDARHAYTPQQVQALRASVYLGDPRHWLILLGLYTGARINELAQLHIADFKVIDGIHVLDINMDSPDKQLKNAQSKRQIPIHSALVALGLLTYVENLRSVGIERLFMKFPHGRDSYGHAASRWFQRHRKKHGLKPVFHALRQTFATRLREVDVAEDVVAELLGHGRGNTMSFGLYAKESSMGKLKAALEKLTFS